MKRKIRKPKPNEMFYYITPFGDVHGHPYTGELMERMYLKIGNFFYSQAQAEKYNKRWLKLLKRKI